MEDEEEEEEVGAVKVGRVMDAVLMAMPSSKQSSNLSTLLIGPSRGRNWNSLFVNANSSEGRTGCLSGIALGAPGSADVCTARTAGCRLYADR